ncbi:MAG TPA: hypothetical protein VEA35_15355, partial [Ramlibacter sp.]|nr:hypothetical protein [Ramlibacter sp.]
LARRVAELAPMPLEQALLEYTHLYIRMGCGRRPDAGSARWQEYLAGLKRNADSVAWTCEFRARARAWDTGPPLERVCGCFSYSRLAPARVRLHFYSDPACAESSLAAQHAPARRRELATLLGALARSEPATQVVGQSWLYGVEAYRRLFPAPWLESARTVPPPWQRLPLWGQLVDRHGQVRPALQERFMQQLEAAAAVNQLAACFAFPVIAVEAPARIFAT